jgi:hypothetical protein
LKSATEKGVARPAVCLSFHTTSPQGGRHEQDDRRGSEGNHLLTTHLASLAIAIAAILVANTLQKLIDSGAISRWAKYTAEKATEKSNNRLSRTWRNVLRVFVTWFFIVRLHALVSPQSAPSRIDVLLIAFWTSLVVALFLHALFDDEK